MGPLFTSQEIRERVMALGPFFHEPRNWKASRTPTGPLFTSLEIRERVMSLGPFFHELENKGAN